MKSTNKVIVTRELILKFRKAWIGFWGLLRTQDLGVNFFEIIGQILLQRKKPFFLAVKKLLDCISEYKAVLYVWRRSGVGGINAYLAKCSIYDTSKHVLINKLKVNVVGREFYEQERQKGSSLIFISWHHGHFFSAKDFLFELNRDLVCYGPLECYTRENQTLVVRKFSNPVQMLAKMLSDLRDKKILHYLFDGNVGLRNKGYYLFDKKVYLPDSLIEIIKITGAIVMPITAYIKSDKELDVFIGKGIDWQMCSRLPKDKNIVDYLLSWFENNILGIAPDCVNYSYLGCLENPSSQP